MQSKIGLWKRYFAFFAPSAAHSDTQASENNGRRWLFYLLRDFMTSAYKKGTGAARRGRRQQSKNYDRLGGFGFGNLSLLAEVILS
jgi:hypothetical protein